MIPIDRDFEVKAYLPTNKGGGLLIHLWFRGEHSKDMDVDILKERQKKGEVGRIVVFDFRPDGMRLDSEAPRQIEW